MKLDAGAYIRTRRERPDLRTRREGLGALARRRSQAAGGDSGSSPRELLNRLKEADLDPRRRAQVGERIDNFLRERGTERPSGKRIDLRQTMERIKQSDLSDEEKRELLGRIQNHIEEQKPETESRPDPTRERTRAERDQRQDARPTITVA
ncbi:MAG: hypothetical protein KDD55_06655 [Bdellovibrionales bacterium]|nr:hypothetical protein [Bdellovibrionales bacterium]